MQVSGYHQESWTILGCCSHAHLKSTRLVTLAQNGWNVFGDKDVRIRLFMLKKTGREFSLFGIVGRYIPGGLLDNIFA